MPYTRRHFLQLAVKSGAILTTANLLQSFAAKDFVLPAKEDVRLRFAVASDGHYGEAKTQYDLFYDELTNLLNLEQKDRGLDFSFINGDLYHDNSAFLPVVKGKLDKLAMPYYVSHGNHDQIAESEWKKTFGVDWHYVFERSDIPFIVLNTADHKGEYICPDFDWAAEKLKQYAGAKQLFVFMHITPVKWTGAGIDCEKLVKMFDNQANLKMIFHGHDHDEDNIKMHGQKHYCFDSHIGGSWGTDYRGYRIVEILHSGEIVTYQMNPAKKQMANTRRI